MTLERLKSNRNPRWPTHRQRAVGKRLNQDPMADPSDPSKSIFQLYKSIKWQSATTLNNSGSQRNRVNYSSWSWKLSSTERSDPEIWSGFWRLGRSPWKPFAVILWKWSWGRRKSQSHQPLPPYRILNASISGLKWFKSAASRLD